MLRYQARKKFDDALRSFDTKCRIVTDGRTDSNDTL